MAAECREIDEDSVTATGRATVEDLVTNKVLKAVEDRMSEEDLTNSEEDLTAFMSTVS